jgi:hypothetical protein
LVDVIVLLEVFEGMEKDAYSKNYWYFPITSTGQFLKSCLETDLEFYSKSYEAEWPGKS